jgi:hypothetical protein
MTQPCDCPSTPLPVPGNQQTGLRINYVLNYDGPQTDVYRALVHAIPEGDLECGRPVSHEDGSLEFLTSQPADIYGWTRDGANPRRFHPAWPECIHRAFGVLIQDKQLVVAGRCNRLGCEQFGRPVTLDICRECPVRQMATVYKTKNVHDLIAAMIERGKAANEKLIVANTK